MDDLDANKDLPVLFPKQRVYDKVRQFSSRSGLDAGGDLPALLPSTSVGAQQIRRNAHLTRGLNPAQAAEDYMLGRRSGYRSDLVSRNRDEIRLRLDVEDISGKTAKAPRVSQYLQDRENLAISRDDIDNMVETEGFFEKYVADPAKAILKSPSRILYSMASGVNDMLAMGAGVVDSAARGTSHVTGLSYRGGFGRARDWLHNQSRWLQGELENNPLIGLPSDLKGKRLWDDLSLVLDPEWLITNVSDTAGSMAPAIAAAVVSGGSALAAGGAGGFQEAASLYRQMKEEGKVSDETALTASTAYGIVSAYLNKIPFDKILDKTPVKNIRQKIFKSILAGGSEAATEWAEEPAQALIKTLAEGGDADEVGRNVLEAMKNIDVIPGAFLMGGGARMATSRVEKDNGVKDETDGVETSGATLGYAIEELEGVTVSLSGYGPDGQQVTYEVQASKAVEDIDFDLDVYRKIRDCLG